MTTTPSSLSATIATPDSANITKPDLNPCRRRDKPQLSCNLCRRRKLKCDRGQPCGTCAQRGLFLSCVYVHSNLNRSQPRLSTNASAQDRIGQLEGLVLSLMSRSKGQASTDTQNVTNNSSPGHPSDREGDRPLEDPSQLSENLGRISLDNSGTSYVEGSHWTAILDGIAELRDYFDDDDGPDGPITPATEVSSPGATNLLFGSHSHTDKHSILAAIPSRLIVDRLVSKYFRSMDIAPGISFQLANYSPTLTEVVVVHSPTFLKEYEQFWNNPLATSEMWLGLLFAMMCVALQHQQFSPVVSGHELYLPSAADANQLIEQYREKTIQCLVMGNYLRCVPYTIETLILYMHVEYLRSEDGQVEVWVLFGMIVRLALRMGYHRDASHFPRISPFQAEMRRRVWASIIQLDIVASAQFGLPRMVKESQSDTEEPHNLLEEDIHEALTEAPPERPATTETPIQYLIVKNRLYQVYDTISVSLFSTQSSSYSEVMRLDKVLNDTYQATPPALIMRPMMQSIMDTYDIIVRRLFLALLFHRAQCVLHRKYMIPARNDDRYAYSRTTCIQAALKILHYQWIVDQEIQPGGRLHEPAWKISSIVKQDFLLATTVLCLDLNNDLSAISSATLPQNTSDAPRRKEILRALEGSYQIWQRSSAFSREAKKAAETLKFVLGKAQKVNASMESEVTNPSSIGAPNSHAVPKGLSHTTAKNGNFTSQTPSLDAYFPPMDMASSLQVDASTAAMLSADALGMLSTTCARMTGPGIDIAQENWASIYDTQSIDTFLDMSYDHGDISQFPGE